MFKSGPTDKLLAGITFEYWKNELSGDCSFNMRNQDLEGFYLSVSIAGDKFYVEFVAFDYL